MIGIYKITNPKGKVYIGQSTNIEARKRIYHYNTSYKNSVGPKIYNSINKYKWKNHFHEVIEECTIEQLNERETYWKQHYLDILGWENVLFCNLHDTGGGPRSEETKQNISKGKLGTKGWPKGLKRSKEFGELIKNNTERSNKIKNSIKNNIERSRKISQSMLGKLKTEQHKDNISKNSKGISRNQKPVLQFDKQNNLIKEWTSQTEAGKNLNINQGDISNVIRGKQKTAGGYIWREK